MNELRCKREAIKAHNLDVTASKLVEHWWYIVSYCLSKDLRFDVSLGAFCVVVWLLIGLRARTLQQILEKLECQLVEVTIDQDSSKTGRRAPRLSFKELAILMEAYHKLQLECRFLLFFQSVLKGSVGDRALISRKR